MDVQKQMSIETFLTAAKLLDGSGPEVNTIIQPLVNTRCPRPATHPPLSFDTSQSVYSGAEQQEPSRGLTSRKMCVERKFCSASTSTQPYCVPSSPRKNSTKHSRAAHNELEKTRRANLRGCLETLKTLVPPIADASRNTTLALLTRARDHIKQLEEGNAALILERDRLKDQKSMLRSELERLKESTSHSTTSRPSSAASRLSRDSPVFLEYSPSSKPSQSPQPMIIDPIAEGLLPVLPICYPRPSLYPYLDLNSSLPHASFEPLSFLPIHLRV
uniref:Putative MAD-Like family member n=1 Tax=Angiostrongylus cantonensis TaxID=6313 RepID=C7BVS0_ANGCA|nr:putative MAD-Like family member [Angiostrongylus cantonensis]